MSKLLVFGHQNPDTDTIASAIAFAYLQQQLGQEAEAVALGEPNEETRYALNYFQQQAPRVIDSVHQETDQVALVDHNEAQQSVSDIDQVAVTFVIDHHRIANFETANPLYYRAEPVGCTCTILYDLFHEQKVTIPQHIAGLMLSAIISDTLLFQSPTCTPRDVAAAEALALLADVDTRQYGLALLKAGTNLATKSEETLLSLDAKSFPMGHTTVRIAQVNTVDEQELLLRKEALQSEMQRQNVEQGYDLFVLVVTNILTSNSILLVVGEPKGAVEQAFHTALVDDTAVLPGVVSRKKQVVPPLTEVLGS